jgi:hypothetical protein
MRIVGLSRCSPSIEEDDDEEDHSASLHSRSFSPPQPLVIADWAHCEENQFGKDATGLERVLPFAREGASARLFTTPCSLSRTSTERGFWALRDVAGPALGFSLSDIRSVVAGWELIHRKPVTG